VPIALFSFDWPWCFPVLDLVSYGRVFLRLAAVSTTSGVRLFLSAWLLGLFFVCEVYFLCDLLGLCDGVPRFSALPFPAPLFSFITEIEAFPGAGIAGLSFSQDSVSSFPHEKSVLREGVPVKATPC